MVPTSNGKKVKAPTVQRDDRSFEQLTQEERAKLVKDLKEAEEMWAELSRKLEEEDEPIDEETYEDLADLFSSHDNLVRRFHGLTQEEEEEFDVVAATTTVYNQYQVTDSDRQRIEARVQQRLNMLNGGTGGTVEEYLAYAAAHGAPDGDKKPQDQPN